MRLGRSYPHHHQINHQHSILYIVNYEYVYFVLSKSVMLAFLRVCWFLPLALKLAKEHPAIGHDEQSVGHRCPRWTGELVR